MYVILEHLAIGEYEEALSPSSDITALLCVAQERTLTSHGLPYHKVPIIECLSALPDQLADAVEWIHDMAAGGRRVLVFSSRGQSRPPSVVIAYLCCRMGYSFPQAVELVAGRKSPICLLPDLAAAIEEVRQTQA